MLMKLSSWVTTNEKPRVGSFSCHSTLHGVRNKNFVVVIFGVWIFGLLQERPEGPARKGYLGCYSRTPLTESHP